MSKMNRGGGGVNLLLYVSVESCPKPFQTNTKNFNFGGVLRIQSLPPLIQVNHSKASISISETQVMEQRIFSLSVSKNNCL